MSLDLVIGIVSHNHDDLLQKNPLLKEHRKGLPFQIIVKDNIPNPSLKEFCQKKNIDYVSDAPFSGYGRNHNIIFSHAKALYPQAKWYLVCNPDIIITPSTLTNLIKAISRENSPAIYSIPLYKDSSFKKLDHSIRCFYGVRGFVHSFLFGPAKLSYAFSTPTEKSLVDWASGAFLLLSFKTYAHIKGFDESFHMYCEDMDLCLRAKYNHSIPTVLLCKFRAIHLAAKANRRIFSKSFWWHLKSICRYLPRYYRFKLSKLIIYLKSI